jgi:GT2 family glycosyltransferase
MSALSAPPSVAIIILTWNGRDMTLACLDSVSRIDYPSFRVIVVDNGSQDGTAGEVARLHPEVTVIRHPENLGFSEGNNAGIRHALAAGFDYILLLNNDTAVHPAMLTELVAAAEPDPRIGITGPLIYFLEQPEVVWSAGNSLDWANGEVRRLTVARGDGSHAPYETDYVTGCALCIKRRVIEDIGLMDARFFLYYEDVDWCCRARQRRYRIVVVPRAVMWHKVSGSISQEAPATAYYMARNQLLFLQKNLRGPRRLAAVAAAGAQHVRLLAGERFGKRPRASRESSLAHLAALRDGLFGRSGHAYRY